MKSILDIFRKNLGMKILALALAIVIYYSMRDSKGNTHIMQTTLKGATDGGSN